MNFRTYLETLNEGIKSKERICKCSIEHNMNNKNIIKEGKNSHHNFRVKLQPNISGARILRSQIFKFQENLVNK